MSSVLGGEDLILLVEKVSKKNIKVRFFEINDDDEVIWEAWGKFRESDVHHQYAIVVQTPPYKSRDIDKHANVFIELLRPGDDERSEPVLFRYKPRDAMLSRKRRRICSTTTNTTTSSSSAYSLSSIELPEPVAKTNNDYLNEFTVKNPKQQQMDYQTISEEYNKDQQIRSLYNNPEDFMKYVEKNSDELKDLCQFEFDDMADFFSPIDNMNFKIPTDQSTTVGGRLEVDGCVSHPICNKNTRRNALMQKLMEQKVQNLNLQNIFNIFDKAYMEKSPEKLSIAAKQIHDRFVEFSNKNENGNSLLHDVITNHNWKIVLKTYKIIEYFHLNDILLNSINMAGENVLHTACLNNKSEYIRPLISLGCDPNLQDNQGNTPLHIAVQENYERCIDSFLKQTSFVKSELNINLTNDNGLTPLHMAIRADNVSLTKKLLNYNSTSAKIVNSKDGNNALHLAVLQQHPTLVRTILENNTVSVDHPNRSGQTSIDLAKTLDIRVRKEIVEMLLKIKNDIDCSVKEEPNDDYSESSTAEDDDDDDDNMSSEEIEIKKERSYCNESQNDTKLKSLLSCSDIFSKLVEKLSGDKWIELAKVLQINHLLCLWSNSEGMLSYIRDSQVFHYNTFYAALKKVDPVAACAL